MPGRVIDAIGHSPIVLKHDRAMPSSCQVAGYLLRPGYARSQLVGNGHSPFAINGDRAMPSTYQEAGYLLCPGYARSAIYR